MLRCYCGVLIDVGGCSMLVFVCCCVLFVVCLLAVVVYWLMSVVCCSLSYVVRYSSCVAV